MIFNSQRFNPTLALSRWESGMACPKGMYHAGKINLQYLECAAIDRFQDLEDTQSEFQLKTGRARLT